MLAKRTPWKATYAVVTFVAGLFYGFVLLGMASAAAGIGLLAVLALFGTALMVLVVPVASFFSARVARAIAFVGAAPMFVSGLMGLYESIASGYDALNAVVMTLPAAVVLLLCTRPHPRPEAIDGLKATG